MSREEDPGFLSRWSRRKQRARLAEPEAPDALEPAEAPLPGAAPGALPDVAPAAEGALSEEEIAALPDPDSLGAEDDFTPFLRRGVPELLKRRALRRLWSVNPLFNLRDGLNDYDEDYSDAATVMANLKTLFEPGKGMPQPERWRKPETQEAAAPADAVGDAAAGNAAAGDAAEREDRASDAAAAGAGTVESAEARPEESEPAAVPDAIPGEQPATAAGAPRPAPRRRGAAERRWGGFATTGDGPGGALRDG